MYGFPCQIDDDPLLDLVLSREDNFPNSEERRLFYVAVTRAKKEAYLIANKSSVSQFIVEALTKDYNVQVTGEALGKSANKVEKDEVKPYCCRTIRRYGWCLREECHRLRKYY